MINIFEVFTIPTQAMINSFSKTIQIRMEKNIYVKYTTFCREKVGKIYFFG